MFEYKTGMEIHPCSLDFPILILNVVSIQDNVHWVQNCSGHSSVQFGFPNSNLTCCLNLTNFCVTCLSIKNVRILQKNMS